MRFRVLVIANLALMASVVFADEKMPLLKVGNETYTNVVITTVSATDIFFSYDHGMANAKLKSLDPALQKHFHYHPETATLAEQKQKAANVQYHSRIISVTNQPADSNDAKMEMDDAIAQVQKIVNQPVTRLNVTADMKVATYSPGWFHPGAEKPDFNTVDVRATQELTYGKDKYVTSDLNPGVVFLGDELEFNPMTKYFYTDRSVPKKKLTEVEMLEINRLYRIIGHDEEQLARFQTH
jgi:hypothetical protein